MKSKKGSVLSVIVTIFVMLALISGLLIFMLKENMITLNEEIINNFFGLNLENVEPPVVLNHLEEFEKIQDGIDLKHFISFIGKNEYSKIVVYISDAQHNESNATPDKSNILFMTNGRIANSEEYIKISNDMKYKVIMQRNEKDKSVETVYIVKLMNDIAE